MGQFEIRKSEAPPKRGRFGLVVVFISEVLRIALEQCCRLVFVFFFPVESNFIALYKGDRKYLFNLHPEGDWQSLLQTVEHFEVKTLAEGPEVIRSIAGQLAEVLADYRIADDEIHPDFRRAALKGLAPAED